jgi:hypothetical protein
LDLLAAGRRGEGVAGSPQDRDEEFGVKAHREIALVVDGDGHARVVDEELLAGLVVEAHHDAQVTSPRSVEVTELGVAVTIGVELSVFEPQELECDSLDGKFLLHRGEVGRGVTRRRSRRVKETALERVVVEIVGQRPSETSLLGPT